MFCESRWLATPKRWRFVRGHDKTSTWEWLAIYFPGGIGFILFGEKKHHHKIVPFSTDDSHSFFLIWVFYFFWRNAKKFTTPKKGRPQTVGTSALLARRTPPIASGFVRNYRWSHWGEVEVGGYMVIGVRHSSWRCLFWPKFLEFLLEKNIFNVYIYI